MMQDKHSELGSAVGDSVPQDILSVLPSDPFEQLDIARRITSMAVRSRVSNLEEEVRRLRHRLTEKEHGSHGLEERVVDLELKLQDTTLRLSHALDEQEKLINEKNVLMVTIRKLNRDVAKLETFKRTLMQSLQEDDEKSQDGTDKQATFRTSIDTPLKDLKLSDGDPAGTRPVVDPNTWSVADVTNQNNEAQRTLSLTPRLTPDLTPTGSPKKRSTARSRQSTTGSPKRHYVNENRISLPASQSASQMATAPNSPPPARTPKVDGREFFRHARSRLSYEQFSAFLANIKELNAHRRTREETLRMADEIFGPENKDLFKSFEGLLSRHPT